MKIFTLIKVFSTVACLLAVVLSFSQVPSWSWAQRAGGSNQEQGQAIATDKYGNIYVAGGFYSSSITFGNFTLTNNVGQNHIFIVKYDPSGNVIWAKGEDAACSSMDVSFGIALDTTGNVFITGTFSSAVLSFNGVSVLTNVTGTQDIFLIKFDPTGNVTWAKSAGGAFSDYSMGIATDPTGNVIITGYFKSPVITFDGLSLTNVGTPSTTDLFLAKYSPSGTVLWVRGAGGVYDEQSVSVCTDQSGNVSITGQLSSPSVTFGTITLYLGAPNSGDIFIAKYDGSGNVLWAESFSSMIMGASWDAGKSIAADAAGNLYVTGNFNTDTITFGNFILVNPSGTGGSNDADIFIVKLNPSGNVLWADAGDGGFSYAYGIASDMQGNAYICGYYDFGIPMQIGNFYLPNAGYQDIFVVKYSSGGNVDWARSAGGTQGEEASAIVGDISGHLYITGSFASSPLIFGNDTLNADYKDYFIAKIGNTIDCKADFIAYPDSLDPMMFHFLDQSYGNIVSWYWNFGDPSSGSSNVSSLQNPVHYFAYSGMTYHVCLSITNAEGTCTDIYCGEVYPGALGCQAIFAHYADTLHPNAVQFYDHSVWGVIQWNWDFGDGMISTVKNPLHIYNSPGNYHVCLTIHTTPAYACQATTCKDIYVWNAANCTSYFNYTMNNLLVNYQGHLNNGLPATYNWDFGDSQTGQGMTVQHLYSAAGTYIVSLTTIDTNGCTFISSQPVIVIDSSLFHQVYGQVFAGSFPMTEGFVLLFSLDTIPPYTPLIRISSTDTNGVYYFTLIPDGDYYIYAIPLAPAGYLPTFFGDVLYWQDATLIHLGQPVNPYNIHLIASESLVAGNGSIHGNIVITGMTGLKLSAVDHIMMLLSNSEGKTIAYYDVNEQGDFVFPSLAYGTYWLKAELPGVTSDMIKVVLSSDQPAANVSMTFTGNRILGIEPLTTEITAGNVYPDPVTNAASIMIKGNPGMEVIMELYTITGQMIFSRQVFLSGRESRISLPVNDLPSGLCTLRIYNSEGINLTRKFIRSK